MVSGSRRADFADRPLVVQSDRTLFLEVDHPFHEEARDALLPFAELVKSPEHIHTYRITPISLWNAAAAGLTSAVILEVLNRYGKYDTPPIITELVREQMNRYGKLKLLADADGYYLEAEDEVLLSIILNNRKIQPFIDKRTGPTTTRIKDYARGNLKSVLIKVGYPVEDLAGYVEGEPLDVELRKKRLATDEPFVIRDYQQLAADAFYRGGAAIGGSGVVVLPCGSGKTIVGLVSMAAVGARTLILATNTTAVRQWREEILDKTTLAGDAVGEYSGQVKEIRPVTVATYQIVIWRPDKRESFPHFKLFTAEDWGLIIYDEVHLLPAPVFRVTAEIQTRRRLGLTATLVREDGREDDVFSLIGPKRYDTPWRELEKKRWIAEARCTEIRIGMTRDDRILYASSSNQKRFRVAAENFRKLAVVDRLLKKHRRHRVLIIGHYIRQLNELAEIFKLPLLTGQTPQVERDRMFEEFRRGVIQILAVSKVANFAVDLPDANVAIQISGTFGSRQEEAQRLGRILRPKSGENLAYFYTVVSRDSVEQDYAQKRELFLTEQGYNYTIVDGEALIGSGADGA
jgi:DNA excision repair protein ERCC-3